MKEIFYISGIYINEKQPSNILFILVSLYIYHFDISCKEIKDSHPLKILDIFCKLSVFQFDISGTVTNELQLENKYYIFTIL